jgi:tRNA threonylcarbamoyladenosine biosynthesis protein TsaB
MLLAIDSATRKMGIALYDGVQVLHEAVWSSVNRHSVELAPAIASALDRAGYSVKKLKVIGLAIGPGSYTGLRIGAALAKGLALSQHIPLVGVSTFDILAAAWPVDPEKQLAVVLQAGRGRLAVGWHQAGESGWETAKDPELLTSEELSKKIRKPTLVCGELDEDVLAVLGRKRKNVEIATPAQNLRRPAYLAEIAWARWQAGDTDDPAVLAPVYLQTGENIPA